MAALKIALDINAFEHLSTEHKSLNDLAAMTDVPSDLLRRILRLLAAAHVVDETPTEVYSATQLGRSFVHDPSMRAGISYLFHAVLPAQAALPDYFRSRGYANPATGDEVWKYVTSGDQTFYEWLQDRPAVSANFQTMCAGHAGDRPTWTSFYPIREILRTWREGTALMVDVGGGQGQDLHTLLNLFGEEIRGDLILQDLPAIIEKARHHLDPRITAMAHNFFDPQPIRGARAYYIHAALFNWSDDKVQQILSNLRTALEPGYSQILINENVCVPGECRMAPAATDLIMLSIFNGKTRSIDEWAQVITASGLIIKNRWSKPEVHESVLELELPNVRL